MGELETILPESPLTHRRSISSSRNTNHEYGGPSPTKMDHFSIEDDEDDVYSDGLVRVNPNEEDECGEECLPSDPATLMHGTRQQDQQQHKLNTVLLTVIVFYSVSGGPFGIEQTVKSAGNFYTLLGFLIAPLVWSIPEALITAELGSAIREAAGGVAWIEEAFGTAAAWQAGYLGWVAGATDNGIYPVLFLDYALQVWHSDEDASTKDQHPIVPFLLLSGASIALSFVNWLGLDVVGKMSVTICFIALSPFVLLTILGASQVDPSRWFELPGGNLQNITMDGFNETTTTDEGGAAVGILPLAMAGGIMWRPFLNNLFWNLNSFDSAGSFAADVDDPAKTFPRGMFWSVVMVICCYFFPLLVALGASDSEPKEWEEGYLATVASDVVGKWLGDWMVFAAGVSNIALFQAELSCDAFQLLGMAERGHIPKIFAQRSRFGTPTYGIILGTIVIVLFGVSDLEGLIEMLNFNYALCLLMEYCAFIKLRVSRPDLYRPYKIPLGTVGCILLFIPTFLFTIAIMTLASFSTYIFVIGVNLLGVLLFYGRLKGCWGSSVHEGRSSYDLVNPAANSAAVGEVSLVDVTAEKVHVIT